MTVNHDALFKTLIREFFIEFLELLVPEAAKFVDPQSIEFQDKETVTNLATGEHNEADLIVKTRFRNQPPESAHHGVFLIHLEAQATHRAGFARRMFEYFSTIYNRSELPVYPIAIFSYDRPLGAEPAEYDLSFPDMRVLRFKFRVIQLNRLNWRRFVKSNNPVAAALMAKMKIADKDRPRVKLECLRLLTTLQLNQAKLRLIWGFVETYLKLSPPEETRFEAEMEKLMPEEKQTILELPNSWIDKGIRQGIERGIEQGLERGIEQGIERGIEQGRRRGREETILRQLRRRVGALNAGQIEKIQVLPVPALDDLADALLDFSNPQQLDAWLASSGK